MSDMPNLQADFSALLAEQFEQQLAKIVEVIDDRVIYHLKPLTTSVGKLEIDMKTVKAVLTATNKQVKLLATAMGYTEHKVHNLSRIITDHYLSAARADSELLHQLDERVDKLERSA